MRKAGRRLVERRQAVEPAIGHLKADHRMSRNFLKGALGDSVNPILAAAGFNIRWLMRWLVVFWRWILSGVLRLLDQGASDPRLKLEPAAA
jgi:IS5 family transposase